MRRGCNGTTLGGATLVLLKVVFHLKGRATGRYEITVQFWQRGDQIAVVVALLEVLAVQPVFAARCVASARRACSTPATQGTSHRH